MAAYGLKYQTEFYNIFGTSVILEIYKRDYSGDSESIIVTSVTMEWGVKESFNTPIAGTVVNVELFNENEFDYYKELVSSYDRTYKCLLKYNGEVIFEGYNVTELNEVELLPYNKIRVKFTDYLARLQHYYPQLLSGNIGSRVCLLDLLDECLEIAKESVGLTNQLYVNSSLLEDSIPSYEVYGPTFIRYSYFEKAIFYKNEVEYDNAYEALNKALLPFSAFLYSYGQKWVIERYEDIGRSGLWVEYVLSYSDIYETYTDSLKQTLNKQNGDFEYVGCTQSLEFVPALQKLKVNLNFATFKSVVFNDFANYELGAHSLPSQYATVDLRKWYVWYQSSSVSNGYNLGGISSYIKWSNSSANYKDEGIYYKFVITTESGESELYNSALNIRLKYTPNPRGGFQGYKTICVRAVHLIIASGPLAGKFITIQEDGTITTSSTRVTLTGPLSFTEGENVPINQDSPEIYLEYDETINLHDLYPSIGYNENVEFILWITPFWYSIYHPVLAKYSYGYFQTNYVGDIEVNLNTTTPDNVLEATIDEDFVNEEKVSLDAFDCLNMNFASGISVSETDLTSRTSFWESENYLNSSFPYLQHNFVWNKFQRRIQSKHKLSADIMTDKYIKPFALISDNNIVREESSGSKMEFIVTSYKWDLYKGVYSIEAEEYNIDPGLTFESL